MTRKEQVKILDDKIKANKIQYNLDRINAEISAYSSGDLPKYEYLTEKDLNYKPNAFEQAKFEYSPLGKVFTDGLHKSDKKVGIFQRLKNIEDNLNSNGDNGDNGNNGNRKVGIFQIIKDIKDKGIKICNDDEAIKEIREYIQNLRNEGIKVNNFDEINKELKNLVQNLKDEGINVNINNDQINELVNKIFKGINEKDSTSKDLNLNNFFKEYENEKIKTFHKISVTKYDIDNYEINDDIKDYIKEIITKDVFLKKYNDFINKFNLFKKTKKVKENFK